MSTNAAVPPTSRRPVVTVSRLVERLLGGSRDAAGRPKDSIEEAEEAGLVFAFRARCVAILIVALALVAIVSWPRDLYYLAFVAAFFVSGYVPFRLRRHPRAELVKLGFVALDVALIAAAILNFPASNLSIDWPIQARLRNQNFLFMLLLLGEAALTYSPRRVVWTGASIATIWSLAFIYLYQLPESKRYGDMGRQQTDSELLNLFLNPTYVSLPQWLAQLIATGILTALLAIAVHRSRMHLLAQVEAQVLRSELARYVSPDVADALAQNPAAEFGAPTVRQVAVLFADIVGFTRLNERLSPERTLGLIRSFQERSTAVVFRHRGTLDKYLGDGFMATFGGLREEPDAPARAIACAFALKAEFERWNAKRSARQADQISVAIGVHFGSVVVGNFGVERRIEFTVLGDVVNVASRLEKATRELGCIIAVSDDCARAAAETMHLSNFDRSVRSAGAVRPSSFTRPEYLNKVVQAHDGAFLSREASPEEHSKDLSVIQGRLQQRREHRQIGCLSNRPVRPSCAQVTVLVASTEQAVRRESRTRVMAIHQPESQPL